MSDKQSVPPAEPAEEKKSRNRSPAYPAIGIKRALELTKKLWELDRQQPVLVTRVATNLDFSAKSSAGMLAISAMKKYGLLSEEGEGKERKMRVTDSAVQMLNPSNTNGPVLIKEASLRPEIHAELWNKYQGDLPSDGTMQDYLKFERKFTDEAARLLISQFRDTIAFAKIASSDKAPVIEHTVRNSSNPAKITPHHSPKRENHTSAPAAPVHTPPAVINRTDLIDFPVPLPSGVVAYYRLPSTMSEADFKFYTDILSAYKNGLVRSVNAEGAKGSSGES